MTLGPGIGESRVGYKEGVRYVLEPHVHFGVGRLVLPDLDVPYCRRTLPLGRCWLGTVQPSGYALP